MSNFAHLTVLRSEVVDQLAPRAGATYCDCTLGGAGHSLAILEREPAARLIGIDRDPAALAAAHERLPHGSIQIHGRFSDIGAHLAKLGIATVDGFVLDLGVSSPQLDDSSRGFSFMHAGPIDMRMDPTQGPTALELIHDLDVDDLANVIFEFGEERHSRKIARLLKAAAAEGSMHTTLDLANVIAGGIPTIERHKSKIHPATRTFQALRIAVNRELDELTKFLVDFPALLAPGGRCAVISFHSLEDRIVKNVFRDLAWTSSLPDKYAIEAGERTAAVCTQLTKKSIKASDEEIARNPRARSAHLRACERTSAPYVPMIVS